MVLLNNDLISLRAWKMAPGGQLLEVDLSAPLPTTLDAVSACLPGGAYTTFRTYDGSRVLGLEHHISRLEQTAREVGKSFQLDRVALRFALRSLLPGYPAGQDLRFRLTLDLEDQAGDLYLAAEPLHLLPTEAYRQGVSAVTTDLHRLLPKAKLTRFIARASQVRQTLPPGVNEAIMVDAGGNFLEGLSSNFFAVVAGEIWTAEEGVLAGITRSQALEAAQRLNILVHLQSFNRSQWPLLQEVFITSASRGVLPVVQVDHQPIGSGRPGALTSQVMSAFEQVLHDRLEEI